MLKTYLAEFPKNFKLAYPVMLGQMGHVLVGLIDNLMVGRLGAVDLAAVSLANSVFHIVMVTGLGISFALTPFVSAADGKGDTAEAKDLFRHGFVINTVLALLMYTIVSLFAPFLYNMGQPIDVVDKAIPYLNIIMLSFIPMMIFQNFKQFSEGLGLTKPPMYATLIGNVLNTVVNYVLIFGAFGAPKLGIIGAGIGTVAARVGMLLVIYFLFQKSGKLKSFMTGLSFKGLRWEQFKRILKIGIPTGLQMLFEVGAFAVSVFFIGIYGANYIAAHQISMQMISLSYMLMSGLGAAATIRVGNQLGKGNIPYLRTVGFSILLMVTTFMTVFGIIFIIGRNFIPQLFIDDMAVSAICAPLMIVAAFFQLSDGLQVGALGALRGLQDVKVPTIYTFLAYWVIAIPTSYILGVVMEWKAIGVWVGLGAGLTVSAILLTLRFNKKTKQLINQEHKAHEFTEVSNGR